MPNTPMNIGIIANRNITATVVNQQKTASEDYCQLHDEMWSQQYIGKKFTGKMSQRGAGSQKLTGILCSKVVGGGKKGK